MKHFMTREEFLVNTRKVDFDTIIEGININNSKKIVSYDDSHQKNVDTSTILNPTTSYVKGYPVISIFKRNKKYDKLDGNPLVYALKDIFGWKISDQDIIKLLKQFIRISEKIEPKYDTIISIPSSNKLNKLFLERINKIIKCDVEIKDQIFTKMYIEDVLENIDFSIMSDIESNAMNYAFSEMEGEYFKFKTIPVDLRKYIKKIWAGFYSSGQLHAAQHINGKDILVLDDTIASGQTISSFCDAIIENYTPRSITIITLFSKL